MKVFVDSNIPMYVAGRDHPNRSSARRFLEQVRTGDVSACTSVEVLQEILWRYSALGAREMASQIYDLFVEVCPIVLSVTLADTDEAKRILMVTEGISARDALHAAVMKNHEISWIATFDTGFDRVAGIRRWQL